MPCDKENGTMVDLVKVKVEERVGAKRRLSDLQESCSTKRCKVPGSVSEAVGLAVELVDDAVVASPPGTDNVVDSRIDELSERSESIREKVISLTAKLSDSGEARDKEEQKSEKHLKTVGTEAIVLAELIVAKWDGALSYHHDVLRSIRGTVMAADERNAAYTDRLTQLRLPSEEGSKVKAVFSSAGPSQQGPQVTKPKSALEAKESELQTLRGLAAENSTLRTEAVWLWDSVETLGRERRKIVMLTQYVRDFAAHFRKIQADAEVLRKRNMKFAGVVWDKVAQATVKPTRAKAIGKEVASVKPKLIASSVECANSR